jgi:hypothetical protein
MWQPARGQWAIIWTVALLVVLAWPPDKGRSLGTKLVNWAVDPSDALPGQPPPLPMGLDDDGDAVAEHDMLETAYYQARDRSASARLRIDLKNAGDPMDPSTQRQGLVGLIVVGALLVWRLDGRRSA